FVRQKGQGNKDAFHAVVDSGPPPGILAYIDGKVVGWCAVAPREEYQALDRSRVLKPLDATPVWSATCFWVRKKARRQGITVALLGAAMDFVKQQGGQVVEGYPVEPKKDEVPAVFAWTGLASAFLQAGFKEAGRGSPTRPIMRYQIGQP